MDVLIAIAHILGSFIAMNIINAVILKSMFWKTKHDERAWGEEVSIALSIPLDKLEDDDNLYKIVEYAGSKFSPELFRNRLSDLVGSLQVGWLWIGIILQYGLIIAVAWYTITDSSKDAIYAWWVIAIAFIFWISSFLLEITCKLLTGRIPGQAKQARKKMTEFLQKHQPM